MVVWKMKIDYEKVRLLAGQIGVLMAAGVAIEGLVLRQSSWAVICIGIVASVLLMWISSLKEVKS